MEELSLFDFTKNTQTENKTNKKTAQKITKETEKNEPSLLSKKEFYLEFALTMRIQEIKDYIIKLYLDEGLKKREINKILKGLFFKEKIFNTKFQAMQYLTEIPHTYAVKYKIGIEPSPKIITLSEKLEKKKTLLENYKKEIKEKFKAEFMTCKSCKSRLNMKYVKNYNCPLCNEELRNATLLQKLKKTEILVENLKTKLEFETRKYNSHFTGGEQWIVRVVNNLTTEKQK